VGTYSQVEIYSQVNERREIGMIGVIMVLEVERGMTIVYVERGMTMVYVERGMTMVYVGATTDTPNTISFSHSQRTSPFRWRRT
jgi:hypothetical protein